MSSNPELAARIREFSQNIWNHSEDQFQASFDTRPPIPPEDITYLRQLIDHARSGSPGAFASLLRTQLLQRREAYFFLLLQLCGLTRSKVIGDLKAAHPNAGAKGRLPGTHMGLVTDSASWNVTGPYLTTRLLPIAEYVSRYDDPEPALQAINLATWPGFIRQERAKRQGHEAEGRLAQLLAALDLPFEPVGKAVNPLCADATVAGVSFDLVVPSVAAPRVCIKSTVHTSNIGQFGESKDHLEVDEARRHLDERFSPESRPVLLALIDGIGFNSNRAGLTGVLEKADEFCQFRTIWKAVVLAAEASSRRIRLHLPPESIAAHRSFLERRGHSAEVHVLDPASRYLQGTVAGEATVELVRTRGAA